MKERPILFRAPMVRAILAGQKTQTRRPVNTQPSLETNNWCFGGGQWMGEGPSEATGGVRQTWPWKACPYGHPGDRLWVRETCRAEELANGHDGVRYLADDHWRMIENTMEAADAWCNLNAYRGKRGATVPPIHMPRWASRILLEVVSVRVERLQIIGEQDAEAEGVDFMRHIPDADEALLAKELYQCLWDAINGDGAWTANPWVWVIEFRRIEA